MLKRGNGRRLGLFWLVVLGMVLGLTSYTLAIPTAAPAPSGSQEDPLAKARILNSLRQLPLTFVENQGQVDARVRFYVKTAGQTIWFTEEGVVFDLLRKKPDAGPPRRTGSQEASVGRGKPGLRGEAANMISNHYERLVFQQNLVGAARHPRLEGKTLQAGRYHFFLGNDPSKWRTDVPGYREVYYREVYPGIDLKVYGNGRDLEQEFVVRPGADPAQIRVAYRGVERLRVAQDGSLRIQTAFGELRESPPRIYQEINGQRVEVAGRFRLLGETTYTFAVGPHHPQYALVIDPTFAYSTYLGGFDDDFGWSIAVNGTANAYVTGWTSSLGFPTVFPFQGVYAGSGDIFVAELNSTGTALLYSTYIGGSGEEGGRSIRVNSSGNVYLTGFTTSSDFPLQGAYQSAYGGDPDDGFVLKLNAAGSALLYSTYLGGSGSDVPYALVVDGSGQAYVTGFTTSTNYPTQNAYQGTNGGGEDVIVTKLNASGSGLVFSTYLGGSGLDNGYGLAVDSAGKVYVAGWTTSTNFPTANPYQAAFGGGLTDAFVTKLNAAGSALVYSTYLGGSEDDASYGLALGASGSAYVTGWTSSTDFPAVNAFQGAFGGILDAFVTKLNTEGSALVYSTYLGGSGIDAGYGIALDGLGNAIITGIADSTDFPTVSPIQGALGGFTDAFIAKLSGSVLSFSTYLGGSDFEYAENVIVDGSGSIYVIGETWSTDYPTTPGAWQTTSGGNVDAFVSKIAGCSSAGPSVGVLWPPNHKYVPVTLTGVTGVVTITGVTQDEPINGLGDGDTCPDAVIEGTTVQLRAERSGTGNGRVYQIHFVAENGTGGSCVGSVKVGVPHSMKPGLPIVDDGQIYDSTGPSCEVEDDEDDDDEDDEDEDDEDEDDDKKKKK